MNTRSETIYENKSEKARDLEKQNKTSNWD